MPTKKITINKNLGKNPFYNQVMNVFVKSPYAGFNFKQVSKQMGISDKASRELVSLILEELCRTDELIEAKRGKFKLNPAKIREKFKHNTITGRVDMKETGKAYIISNDDTEDIYIAANNTNRALNGDTVKVMLFPKRSGRKPEGQIVEVLERAHKNFVGVISISGKFGFLIPDDVRMPVDIIIPGANLKGAKDGEKVLALMTDWPEHSKNPFGEVLEVLGKPGEHEVEMSSILANYDFPLSFSRAAEQEAEQITDFIPAEEYAKRRDFREIFTITIDPIDAKDFDDALSLKKLPNGNWEVGVHIADVSHFVRPGMAIDKEAYERATSVYLVDRTFPMLPEKLSNKVCSLRADEEKLCFSTVFEMTEKAEVISEWFGKTVILSNRRFTYEEVQDMLDGNPGDFKEEILILDGLAKKLRAERFKKGSINFRSREVKFRLDEFSRPVEAFIKEQNDSHRLIEDFMLLSNKKVAEKIGKKKGDVEPKSFVYRIHDEPNPDKLSTFVEFVAKLGYAVKTGSRKTLSTSLNQLFDKIAGKGEENLVETIAIRTMSKAVYSTKNIGHYGLAFTYYTHFTSPIRRYPDLMVHRLLEAYMEGKPSVKQQELEDQCKHSSEMERNAADAERASVKFKQAEFMLDKIGQDFSGLISGVGKWGFWVELDINKGEGMVPMRSLQDDYYYLDEDNFKIVGERRGREFRLGDAVMIKVKNIDLARKQMDFEIVE